MTELGRLLKIIRVNSGDTAKEMAGKLYMSPSYLSAIESGKRNIPANLIGAVADVYDLSPEDKEKLRDAVLGREQAAKNEPHQLLRQKKEAHPRHIAGRFSRRRLLTKYVLSRSETVRTAKTKKANNDYPIKNGYEKAPHPGRFFIILTNISHSSFPAECANRMKSAVGERRRTLP